MANRKKFTITTNRPKKRHFLRKSQDKQVAPEGFLAKIPHKALIALFISGIILPVCVSYLTFQYTSAQNTKNEQKHLANEFYYDIDYVELQESLFENSLNDPTMDYSNPDSPFFNETFVWITPLYPDWGMYYSNRQDINKFSPALSSSLSIFYQDVLTAETERQIYMYYDKMVERDPNDTALEENRATMLHDLFDDMREQVNSTRQRIPELKQQLADIASS